MTLYPIPNAEVETGELIIAVRVWVSRFVNTDDPPGGITFNSRILLGETAEEELNREQDVANTASGLIPLSFSLLITSLIGCAALVLYRTQRANAGNTSGLLSSLNQRRSHAGLHNSKFDLLSITAGTIIASVSWVLDLVILVELVFAFSNRSVPRFFRVVQWSLLRLGVPSWMGPVFIYNRELLHLSGWIGNFEEFFLWG